MMSREEAQYYHRQIILESVGLVNQLKIKKSSLLIIGAGGLGCPLLLMCSGMGIGKIGIADFDTVIVQNLHRQFLYDYQENGLKKVSVASGKIRARNPFIQLEEHEELLNAENADRLIGQYDIIADGTDNFDTRYILNDACVRNNKPLISGSIFQWTSQVALFNYNGSKNLRDLYPEPPLPGEAPSCSEAGVMNTVTTHCASLMAQLILNCIIGRGEEWKNKLILTDLWNFRQDIISF